MRKLAELISVATRKTGPFEVVDFLARAWGVYARSLSWRMSLLISARRDFCYFLWCLLRLFCRKAWLLILKVPGLGLLCKSEQETTTLAFLAQFWQVAPRFAWWAVRTSFRLFLTLSYNVPFWSLWRPSMLGYVVQLKWSNEKTWQKEEHVRDV